MVGDIVVGNQRLLCGKEFRGIASALCYSAWSAWLTSLRAAALFAVGRNLVCL